MAWIKLAFKEFQEKEMFLPISDAKIKDWLQRFAPYRMKAEKEAQGRDSHEKCLNTALKWIEEGNLTHQSIVELLNMEKQKLERTHRFYSEFFYNYGYLELEKQYQIYKIEYMGETKYLTLTDLQLKRKEYETT